MPFVHFFRAAFDALRCLMAATDVVRGFFLIQRDNLKDQLQELKTSFAESKGRADALQEELDARRQPIPGDREYDKVSVFSSSSFVSRVRCPVSRVPCLVSHATCPMRHACLSFGGVVLWDEPWMIAGQS